MGFIVQLIPLEKTIYIQYKGLHKYGYLKTFNKLGV